MSVTHVLRRENHREELVGGLSRKQRVRFCMSLMRQINEH